MRSTSECAAQDTSCWEGQKGQRPKTIRQLRKPEAQIARYRPGCSAAPICWGRGSEGTAAGPQALGRAHTLPFRPLPDPGLTEQNTQVKKR